MNEAKSWQEMRRSIADMLEARTGEDVVAWNKKIAERGPHDEGALRTWLAGQGVTGYPQMLLVMERFGYPEWYDASADELIDAQYADRPALRPILDAVVTAARTFGEVTVQARKGYVSLLTPRRTFAVVKASTRARVDLGLRIDGQLAVGRLKEGSGIGGGSINLKLGLESVEELDDEAMAWLEHAYRVNN